MRPPDHGPAAGRRLLALTLATWLVVAMAAVAAAPVAAVAAPAKPKAPAKVTLPPDLVALLARGAALHIPYEIVQSSSSLNVGTGFSDTLATSEARTSPPELATSSGSGAQAVHDRLIGGVVYLQIPGLAAVAHGRHWVRATPRELGVTIPQLLGSAQAVPGHPDGSLNKASAVRALLTDASSIRELGPSALNGEPVTEFLATVGFSKLLGMSPAASDAGPDSTVYVQLYFAADGLLKRLSVNLDEIVTTTTDLLTDTVPVVVHRPPARDVVRYSPGLVQALDDSLSSADTGPSSSGTQTVPFDITAWLTRPTPSPFGPLRNAFAGA